MSFKPTKRDLEILAAWWYTKGSNERAARVLSIGRQPVKNALYRFRRADSAQSNLDLALRYMDEIEKCKHKIIKRAA